MLWFGSKGGGEVLRQRTLKGKRGLVSFMAMGFVLSMLSRYGVSFPGYVKQVGSKWLNICLFGFYLKQFGV